MLRLPQVWNEGQHSAPGAGFPAGPSGPTLLPPALCCGTQRLPPLQQVQSLHQQAASPSGSWLVWPSGRRPQITGGGRAGLEAHSPGAPCQRSAWPQPCSSTRAPLQKLPCPVPWGSRGCVYRWPLLGTPLNLAHIFVKSAFIKPSSVIPLECVIWLLREP